MPVPTAKPVAPACCQLVCDGRSAEWRADLRPGILKMEPSTDNSR
jgi:hypothetical protein